MDVRLMNEEGFCEVRMNVKELHRGNYLLLFSQNYADSIKIVQFVIK